MVSFFGAPVFSFSLFCLPPPWRHDIFLGQNRHVLNRIQHSAEFSAAHVALFKYPHDPLNKFSILNLYLPG